MTDSAALWPGGERESDGPAHELRAIQPRYIYQQVAQELERFITANQLKQGDLLPSERDLCIRLGTSRPTLREAVRTLELVGLVEIRRGGRMAVGAFDLKLLTEWIGRSIPRSTDNLRGLLDVRDVLEVRAAELAATHITAEQLERMSDVLERTRSKIDRGEEALAEDVEFHEIIFEACGNAVLQRLVGVVAQLLVALRQEILAGSGGGDSMLRRHLAVYDALRAGDPAAAASAMREHIQSVIERATQILDRTEGKTPK